MSNPRRPRQGLTSPTPSSSSNGNTSFTSPAPPGLADDISHLSLPEVQERLARNTRVLSTGLFAAPPMPGPSSSSSPLFSPTPSAVGVGIPGSSSSGSGRLDEPRPISAGTSPTDLVRDRLLSVRRQLMQREKELLMASSMGGLQLGTMASPPVVVPSPATLGAGEDMGAKGKPRVPGLEEDDEGEEEAESSAMAGRKSSAPTTGTASTTRVPGAGGGVKASGKRAAMVNIQEREKGYAPNGLILPVSESMALAARDFDHQTATRLSSLSLNPAHAHAQLQGLDMGGMPRSSSSPKRRHRSLAYADDSPISGSRPSRKAGLAGEDENARAAALARVSAFMSYRPSSDDEDEDGGEDIFDGVDGDGVDGMFDFEEPDYPDSGALDGEKRGVGGGAEEGKRREKGTGERVDRYGEDDERWGEGNEDLDEGQGGEGMEM